MMTDSGDKDMGVLTGEHEPIETTMERRKRLGAQALRDAKESLARIGLTMDDVVAEIARGLQSQ